MKRIVLARLLALVAVIACLLWSVAGCILDRWAAVEPGTYTVVRSAGRASQVAAQEIQKLEIDRDARTATFTLVDSSELTLSFTPRDRSDWPAGCPSNVNNTRMEVLDLGRDTLTIGPLIFTDPLLVRDCPPDPVHVVLREGAGEIGGSGTACAGTDECVTFAPGEPSSPPRTAPAGSVKGYELYSWPVGQEWRFSLVIGTDRVKTYEEVTHPESGAEAVLTAGSVGDVLAALDQLPSGAQVLWRGPEAVGQIGMEAHELALPPQVIVSDVIEHAEETDLNLVITP